MSKTIPAEPTRILVVDDEKVVRLLMADALETAGFVTDQAADGEQALRALHEGRYQAMIADIMMPKMDGLALLGEVRRLHPDVVVVLVTAWASLDKTLQALHLGADDFLPKPFPSAEYLVETLRRALSRREQERRVTVLCELNHAKDEFLALFSHELRTPLTSLSGAVELLKADAPRFSADVREVLGIADDSLRQLRALVEDLSLVFQFRRHAPNLALAQVDLALLLGAIVEDARHRGAARRVSIALDVATPAPPLRGDSALLGRALAHLLDNAVKFSPPSGLVRVSLTFGEQGAIIRVADQGPGIAPDRREAVFEPFVKLAKAMTNDNRGSGLGLPIARGVAQAHGGTVAVESDGARGAVFTMTLPGG